MRHSAVRVTRTSSEPKCGDVDTHTLYILFVGVDLVSHVTSHTDGLAIAWNIRPTLRYDIQVKFTFISCSSGRLDTLIEFISNAYRR